MYFQLLSLGWSAMQLWSPVSTRLRVAATWGNGIQLRSLVPGREGLSLICSAPCSDCLTTGSLSVTERLLPVGMKD